MKRLFTLLLTGITLTSGLTTKAQQPTTAAAYPFVASNKPYTYLSGGTPVSWYYSSVDDDFSPNIPIGFTFTFCGSNYTTVTAMTNGFMVLGYSSYYYYYPADVAYLPYVSPTIFAGWCDAMGASGNATSYLTTGTAPNRVFTLEFKNWSNWSGGPPAYISYQYKLYENGCIELLYKQESGTAGFASSAAIGIANSSTDWQTLSSTGTSPTASSSTFYNSSIAGTRPVTGQSYFWGIDKVGYNNAGVSAAISPTAPFCSGNYNVQVQIKNKGKNKINSVKVYWELDGVPQPFVTYNTPLDSVAPGDVATVTLGSVNYSNVPRTIKAYTSMPNGVADTVTKDDTLVFTKRSSPLALITTTGQTVYCGGGAVNTVLNATTGTGYSYQWRYNGNNIPGATATTYTANAAGDYTLRVDSGGCYNISPILRIDNIAMPQPSISPEAYGVFCFGDSITLNANAGISGATYQWQLQGTNIPGATNASYVAKVPGNYTVKTTKFSCTVTSPGTNVSQVAAPNPTITKNGTLLSTAGNYVSYQWYVNGNALPADTFSVCIAKVAGTYTVKVSNGGCFATSGGSDVSESEIMLGISTANPADAIKIYPNPATTTVHIACPANCSTSIYGVDGKTLIKEDKSSDIDIHSLTNGIYIIKVTDANGLTLKLEKLIKQ